MAKFIFENSLRPDTPKSEKTVYAVIKNSFGDDWSVFHSVGIRDNYEEFNYRTNRLESLARDVEIDFILHHPEHGVVVLEVKGGENIKYENGEWYSNGNKIDPFMQALKEKHALMRLFSIDETQKPPIPFAHAVCFAEGSVDEKTLPPEAEGITIQKGNLVNLKNFCIEILKKCRVDRRGAPLSIEAIRGRLSPSCGGEDDLPREIKFSGKIFSEQTRPLLLGSVEILKDLKRANVRGCAGSGKTFIAQTLARKFAKSGKSVLLACYNRALASKLKEAAENVDGLEAVAFLDFCCNLSNLSKEEIDRYQSDPRTWPFAIPKMAQSRIEKYGIGYGAVIVDEGQDFSEEMWKAVQMLVSDGGSLHVFYDTDQKIYEWAGEIPQCENNVSLSRNLRNAKKIFEKIKPMMSFENAEIPNAAPEGRNVEEYFIPCEKARLEKLCGVLEGLKKQGVKGKDIVILGARSLKNTCLKNCSECGGYKIAENYAGNDSGVVSYMTYMKFKGCESPAVVLLDVDKSDMARWPKNALYTAMSRAQSLLIILHSTQK